MVLTWWVRSKPASRKTIPGTPRQSPTLVLVAIYFAGQDVVGPLMLYPMAIGATCVGGMEYTYAPDSEIDKGAEKGFFKFGGSSTMLLFEKGRIRLDEDLVKHSSERRELYARMGDRLGVAAG